MTEIQCQQLEACFKQTFGCANEIGVNTRPTLLEGGFDEPVYLPEVDGFARVRYREDYLSSALHELAHWSLVGAEREALVDYGYWYEPDGRTPEQQQQFEQVEIRPQALEWLLSAAIGQQFHFSADNLNGQSQVSEKFKQDVKQQAWVWREQWLQNDSTGQDSSSSFLPKKAALLLQLLVKKFDGQARLQSEKFEI